VKLNNKFHWEQFTYGLLYPGFVGSMIYELIPQEPGNQICPKSDSDVNYWTLNTIIKILITFFYTLDYFHLYGDMEKAIPNEHRNWNYIRCDIATCVLFFAAFVFVKLEHYDWAVYAIALIPFLFSIYKRVNKVEAVFHKPYYIISIAVVPFFILSRIFKWNLGSLSNDANFLGSFVTVSLLTYGIYVFDFYERKAKPEYERLFPIKKTV
jgi:hypothetical protein